MLYAFDPIPLPSPPPAAPGTDFQDLAASELGGNDAADAGLVAALGLMSGSLTTDLAGADDLVAGLDQAAAEMSQILADADQDDLTNFLALAQQMDAAFASLSDNVDSDLGNVISSLADQLLGSVMQSLYLPLLDAISTPLDYLSTEVYSLADQVSAIYGELSLLSMPGTP